MYVAVGLFAQRRARVWRVGGIPAMFPSIGRMQNGEIYPLMRSRRAIWQSSGPPVKMVIGAEPPEKMYATLVFPHRVRIRRSDPHRHEFHQGTLYQSIRWVIPPNRHRARQMEQSGHRRPRRRRRLKAERIGRQGYQHRSTVRSRELRATPRVFQVRRPPSYHPRTMNSG